MAKPCANNEMSGNDKTKSIAEESYQTKNCSFAISNS